MDEENLQGGDMEEEFIDPDDIVEVIELDDDQNGVGEDELVDDLEDMALNGEDGSMVQDGANSDDADIVFNEHNGSVFCVAADPGGRLAVTGGEDDLAYVWDLTTGEISFKCTGHKDSVVAAAFNRNGRYVATADMSGLVQVWTTGNGHMVWSAESSDIEWLSWHHMTDAVLAGTADGAVWMWRVPSGECKIYQGPDCACACGKVSPDGKLVVSGYGDGSVRVWDLKEAAVIYSTSGQDVHGDAVTSLDVHSDNNLVLTTSSDGTAKLININHKKVIYTIPIPATTTAPQSVADDDGEASADVEEMSYGLECGRFCPTFPYLAVCCLDGRLVIWDVSNERVRSICEHTAGVVNCVWDREQPVIFTCTLDGLVHMFDSRTGAKLHQWSGHQSEILDLQLTKDSTRLLTASDDGAARVFSVDTADR